MNNAAIKRNKLLGFIFTSGIIGLLFNTFTKVFKKMNISKFNDITKTDKKLHSGLHRDPSSHTVNRHPSKTVYPVGIKLIDNGFNSISSGIIHFQTGRKVPVLQEFPKNILHLQRMRSSPSSASQRTSFFL